MVLRHFGLDAVLSESVLAVITLSLLAFMLFYSANKIDRESDGRIAAERRAQKAMTEFQSTVSHELRTPLTAISASLKLLEHRVVDPGGPRGSELVVVARTSADRLVRLINDLLDLNKLEAGRLELNKRPLSVGASLDEILSAIAPLASSQEIAVRKNVQTVALICADQDRFQQIVVNLLSNAIKFSERGNVVDIAAEEQGEFVLFSVTDRGVGIPESELPKLFGKFQQLDSSDNRNHGGTGLGLFVTKVLVEQHGGSLSVQSKPGIGSTFLFTIPRFVEDPIESSGGEQIAEMAVR